VIEVAQAHIFVEKNVRTLKKWREGEGIYHHFGPRRESNFALFSTIVHL
jgi:hypothetical protein